MIVKILDEHHMEFLSLKGGSYESTHIKMPHCWTSHALPQLHPIRDEVATYLQVSSNLVKVRYCVLMNYRCVVLHVCRSSEVSC